MNNWNYVVLELMPSLTAPGCLIFFSHGTFDSQMECMEWIKGQTPEKQFVIHQVFSSIKGQ
jgi:hypothetical protein